MNQHTHQTAPTEFVTANGVRYAYRWLGKRDGIPLILFQHFTGTLDNWDPRVTDGFAKDRPVIIFNNTGVASSEGTTPNTVEEMARDAEAFVDALKITTVDLYGFSLGGMVAQQFVLDRPDLVRKLIVVGSGPKGGEGMAQFGPEAAHIFFEKKYPVADEIWLDVFFAPTPTSQAAGREFLTRLRARVDNRDIPISAAVAPAQLAAVAKWGAVPTSKRYAYLKQIKHPALIMNGSNDIVIPTVNSYILAQELPNAQLIIYPDSNHGAPYQFPNEFLGHVKQFLDGF